MKKSRYLVLVLFLMALLIPDTAFAATNTGVHSILSAFSTQATHWYEQVKVVAMEIFGALFGIELVWMVVQWLITGKDVHDIFTSFVKKLITIGFFYLILLNGHELAGYVINGFQATGVKAAGEPHTGIGYILDTGVNFFKACMHGPKGSSSSPGIVSWLFDTSSAAKATLTSIVSMLVGIIVGLIAILALLYAALEYLTVQIEAFLVTSLGVIVLGFGGSRFTSSYVESYIKYAVSVGIRFFVLVVWIAFLENQAPTVITEMLHNIKDAGGSTIMSLIHAYADVLIFVLLIAWLTKKLPSLASSITGGTSSLSGGELMSGAVKGAALATAAVATGGAALAGGVALAGGAAAATEAGGMAAATGEAGGAAASGASSMGAASGEAGGAAGSSADSMGGGSGIKPPAETPTPNMAASKSSTPTSSGVNTPKLEDVSSRIKPSGQSSNNNDKGGNTETVGQGSPTLNQSGSTDDATGSNDSSTSDSGIVDAAEGAATALGVESVASTLNGAKTAASGVAAPKVVPSNAGKTTSSGGTSKASTDKGGSAAPASDGVDHRAVAPNDTQTSGGSNKGVEAPTDDGSDAPNDNGSGGNTPTIDPIQELHSKMDKLIDQTAPKPPKKESFLETHARHEEGINKVIDTLVPGKSSSDGVSAPSLNVKHLSD